MIYPTPLPFYHVMPAEPGWRVVGVSNQGQLTVGNTVIAWGIKTERSQSLPSTTFGITTSGRDGNGERVFGYLRPDGKVEAVRGELYESMAEAQTAQCTQARCRPANG